MEKENPEEAAYMPLGVLRRSNVGTKSAVYRIGAVNESHIRALHELSDALGAFRTLRLDRGEHRFDAGFSEQLRSIDFWKKAVAVGCTAFRYVSHFFRIGNSQSAGANSRLLTHTICYQHAIANERNRIGR